MIEKEFINKDLKVKKQYFNYMKKSSWIGITAGGVSGLIGAVLVSSFDFSLFSVGLIGLIVGISTSILFNLFK